MGPRAILRKHKKDKHVLLNSFLIWIYEYIFGTNRELCNLTSRVSNPKASEPNIERLTSGCECLNKIYLGWPIDVLAKNVGFVDGDDDPMLPGRDV